MEKRHSSKAIFDSLPKLTQAIKASGYGIVKRGQIEASVIATTTLSIAFDLRETKNSTVIKTIRINNKLCQLKVKNTSANSEITCYGKYGQGGIEFKAYVYNETNQDPLIDLYNLSERIVVAIYDMMIP